MPCERIVLARVAAGVRDAGFERAGTWFRRSRRMRAVSSAGGTAALRFPVACEEERLGRREGIIFGISVPSDLDRLFAQVQARSTGRSMQDMVGQICPTTWGTC